MRYHLLSLEDREDLGESSRPRRKKHDYRIALFGGSQPQSCRYFNPKVFDSKFYIYIYIYRFNTVHWFSIPVLFLFFLSIFMINETTSCI